MKNNSGESCDSSQTDQLDVRGLEEVYQEAERMMNLAKLHMNSKVRIPYSVERMITNSKTTLATKSN